MNLAIKLNIIFFSLVLSTKITNQSLYKKCSETPLSLQILEPRWVLFGQILRRDNSIPANLAILYYFNENSNRGRGRPTTTLPITLINDLKRLQNKDVQLTTKEDLHKLQKIASRRQEWVAFTAEIKRAAEAARPDDQASGRH
ncbi:hypothetical protein ElyMa_006011700 [Elysia marginata]|uniref:Uncharacterized protein n=1 Tax=Elysia marginata TaxID=1093978 RepID=A0AAV4GIK9_9GAST|nr:hypothetical protein ElyMa_006011700 [Elysia marginata]